MRKNIVVPDIHDCLEETELIIIEVKYFLLNLFGSNWQMNLVSGGLIVVADKLGLVK